MKSILISIKPKYVADILNHKKTIEVRKSIPKCELPIDVYIYCTKDNKQGLVWDNDGKCLVNSKLFPYDKGSPENHRLVNGKVVAKFTLNKVEHFEYDTCSRDIEGYWLDNGELFKLKGTCLTKDEFINYIKFGEGYAWHISNLVIFDKPKELSEFYTLKCNQWKVPCNIKDVFGVEDCYDLCKMCKPLTKAPQSFMFVDID